MPHPELEQLQNTLKIRPLDSTDALGLVEPLVVLETPRGQRQLMRILLSDPNREWAVSVGEPMRYSDHAKLVRPEWATKLLELA